MQMNCEMFNERLEAMADGELLPEEYGQHECACVACRLRLARARSLASLLRSLPPADPPPGLKAAVVSAGRRRPLHSLKLLRVAAAILVMVGLSAGIALLTSRGLSYQPLELTVLPMAENGPSDEEYALEVMYGPGIPISETSKEGSGGEDRGAAEKR